MLTANIERMQRRFTRRLMATSYLPYEQRLVGLSIPSLQKRRQQIDLILAYKIMTGRVRVDLIAVGLCKSALNTRSGGINLVVRRVITNYVHKTFNFRIQRLWNSFPVNLKTAMSPVAFKNGIRSH